jgi:acetylornithine deacetylase
MMARVIRAVESRYVPSLAARHPLTGKAQCSINVIRGGTQINIIPDECEVQIDRRLVPGEDPAGVLPAVERLIEELRRDDPGFAASQDAPEINLPLDPRTNEPLALRVGRVLSGLGLPADPNGAGYNTHAADLSAHGVPAVVLGPGDIAQAHTRDEWIETAQVDRAVSVYLALMRSEG